jgi:hypothetical protein
MPEPYAALDSCEHYPPLTTNTILMMIERSPYAQGRGTFFYPPPAYG